jgi:hypothetical protein
MTTVSHALLIANERLGKVVQAGVLRAPDAVLDPGVCPVAGVEVGTWRPPVDLH